MCDTMEAQNSESFSCVFCKESFNNKETLQIHFRKHADPTFNKANTSVKTTLDTTSETSDEKQNAELVSCDVCSEVFPTISKAITHKHKMHPNHDAKYFCAWCGKLFTLKHLYNKHLVSHESLEKTNDTTFTCDVCEVDFYVPSAMIYHNKFFHRQEMELPAIGLSQKQKFVNQELLPIYYCPFCGEEYVNKINLHKHMADDHGDENQSPDEILRCPLCDAIFYHLDAYEIHLTFHGVDDIYNGKDVEQKDITDFNLETAPPIIEKVEEYEPEPEFDMDQLLQITMSGDMSDNDKPKHKKHKKHKKSKKEKTITLDEFLNMNSDVFGEGLDIQGVEEVPTRAVKKIKAKPQPVSAAKTSKANLDKLKKQGIIIKKSSNKPVVGRNVAKINVQGTKIINNTALNINQVTTGIKIQNDKPSSEEILSKLMSQNNSQIKIIKKGCQELSKTSKDNLTIKSVSKTTEDANSEVLGQSEEMVVEPDLPDNNIDSLDKNVKDIAETETKTVELNPNDILKDVSGESEENKTENNKEVPCQDFVLCSTTKCTKNNLTDSELEDNFESDASNDAVPDSIKNPSKTVLETRDSSYEMSSEISNQANILKILSQQITIKSTKPVEKIKKGEKKVEELSSIEEAETGSNSNTSLILKNQQIKNVSNEIANKDHQENIENTVYCQNIVIKSKIQEQNVSDLMGSDSSVNDMDIEQNSDDESIETLKTLKHLSSHITIKPPQPKPAVNISKNLTNINEDNVNNVSSEKQESSLDTNKSITNKSLNVLKGLGITVKSLDNNKQPDLNTHNYIPENKTAQVTKTDNKISTSINSLTNLGITVKSATKVDNNVSQSKINEPKLEESDFEDTDEYDHIPTELNDAKLNTSHVLKNQQLTVKTTNQPKKIQLAGNSDRISEDDVTEDEIPRQVIKRNLNKSLSTNNKSLEAKLKTHDGLSKHENTAYFKNCPDIALKKLGQHITVKASPNTVPEKMKKIENADEIFNIDDSDEEQTINTSSKNTANISNYNSTSSQSQTIVKSDNSFTVTKNISATKSQTILNKSINIPQQHRDTKEEFLNSSEDEHDLNNKMAYVNQDLNKLLSNKGISIKKPTFNKPILGKDKVQNITKKNSSDNHSEVKRSFEGFLSNESDDGDFHNDDIPSSPLDNNSGEEFDELFDDEMESNDEKKLILNKLKSINNQLSIKNLNVANEGKINTEIKKGQPVCKRVAPSVGPKFVLPCKGKQIVKNYVNDSENDDNDMMQCKSEINTTNDQQISTMNTVNKNVTTSVKTIQTNTVVEEITTTVTRTIKTINHSVNQESSSNSTQMIASSIKPSTSGIKTVQGMKPYIQNVKNYQGVKIRPATNTCVRPTRGSNTAIRQAAPFRGPRPCTPRPRFPSVPRPNIPNAARPLTSPSTSKPVKVTPNIIRPMKVKNMPSESEGHFSCFKKPRESLIPDATEAQVHSASMTQMSKSFSSVKTVKGNAVVTATQKVSEMKSSSQQMSKLNSISGLMVTKSSQSKQVVSEEQKYEGSGSKRTLEAIEKLQRQGLLIKKPRIDESENSDFDEDDQDNTLLAIESG